VSGTPACGSPLSVRTDGVQVGILEMPQGIHVLPAGPDDWIVKQEDGRELGHYPKKTQAEEVGRKVARKRKVELLVHDRSGSIERRSRPSRGWLARLFSR
jgi:hypothetical protein